MENKIVAKIFGELIANSKAECRIKLGECEVSFRERDSVIEVEAPTGLKVFELNDPKSFGNILEYINEQNQLEYYTFTDGQYLWSIAKCKLKLIMANKKLSKKKKHEMIMENSIHSTNHITTLISSLMRKIPMNSKKNGIKRKTTSSEEIVNHIVELVNEKIGFHHLCDRGDGNIVLETEQDSDNDFIIIKIDMTNTCISIHDESSSRRGVDEWACEPKEFELSDPNCFEKAAQCVIDLLFQRVEKEREILRATVLETKNKKELLDKYLEIMKNKLKSATSGPASSAQ